MSTPPQRPAALNRPQMTTPPTSPDPDDEPADDRHEEPADDRHEEPADDRHEEPADDDGDDGDDGAPALYSRTDLGNARRFLDLTRGQILHSPAAGYLWWDGRRWARNQDHLVDRAAQLVAAEIHKEARAMRAAGVSAKEVARHRAWAKYTESAHRIRSLKSLAQPHQTR